MLKIGACQDDFGYAAMYGGPATASCREHEAPRGYGVDTQSLRYKHPPFSRPAIASFIPRSFPRGKLPAVIVRQPIDQA